MPDNVIGPTSHADECRLNADFADALESMSSALGVAAQKWALTARFYAAVHWVNGGLSTKRRAHPKTHGERKEMILQVWPREVDARHAYMDLETLSRRARYDLWCQSAQDLKDASMNLDQVKSRLV